MRCFPCFSRGLKRQHTFEYVDGLDDKCVQDASSHGTTLAPVGAIGQVSDAAAASRASGEDEEYTEKEIGGQKDRFTARLGSSTGKNPLALAKPFSRFQSAKSFRIASPGLAFPGAWKADQPVDNIPWLGAVLENTTCAMTVLKWGGSGPTEVLYQNRASTGYYGNVKGRCIGEELLNRLLAVSQEAIAEAFEALIVEQDYCITIKVPATLPLQLSTLAAASGSLGITGAFSNGPAPFHSQDPQVVCSQKSLSSAQQPLSRATGEGDSLLPQPAHKHSVSSFPTTEDTDPNGNFHRRSGAGDGYLLSAEQMAHKTSLGRATFANVTDAVLHAAATGSGPASPPGGVRSARAVPEQPGSSSSSGHKPHASRVTPTSARLRKMVLGSTSRRTLVARVSPPTSQSNDSQLPLQQQAMASEQLPSSLVEGLSASNSNSLRQNSRGVSASTGTLPWLGSLGNFARHSVADNAVFLASGGGAGQDGSAHGGNKGGLKGGLGGVMDSSGPQRTAMSFSVGQGRGGPAQRSRGLLGAAPSLDAYTSPSPGATRQRASLPNRASGTGAAGGTNVTLAGMALQSSSSQAAGLRSLLRMSDQLPSGPASLSPRTAPGLLGQLSQQLDPVEVAEVVMLGTQLTARMSTVVEVPEFSGSVIPQSARDAASDGSASGGPAQLGADKTDSSSLIRRGDNKAPQIPSCPSSSLQLPHGVRDYCCGEAILEAVLEGTSGSAADFVSRQVDSHSNAAVGTELGSVRAEGWSACGNGNPRASEGIVRDSVTALQVMGTRGSPTSSSPTVSMHDLGRLVTMDSGRIASCVAGTTGGLLVSTGEQQQPMSYGANSFSSSACLVLSATCLSPQRSTVHATQNDALVPLPPMASDTAAAPQAAEQRLGRRSLSSTSALTVVALPTVLRTSIPGTIAHPSGTGAGVVTTPQAAQARCGRQMSSNDGTAAPDTDPMLSFLIQVRQSEPAPLQPVSAAVLEAQLFAARQSADAFSPRMATIISAQTRRRSALGPHQEQPGSGLLCKLLQSNLSGRRCHSTHAVDGLPLQQDLLLGSNSNTRSGGLGSETDELAYGCSMPLPSLQVGSRDESLLMVNRQFSSPHKAIPRSPGLSPHKSISGTGTHACMLRPGTARSGQGISMCMTAAGMGVWASPGSAAASRSGMAGIARRTSRSNISQRLNTLLNLRRVVSNTTSLVGNVASANGPTSRNMSVTQKGVLATADNNTVHSTRASMSLSGTATAGNQVSNITGNHAHPGAGMPSPTGNGMANEAVPHAWHRVHLRRFVDSVSGARLVLIQQSDVSEEREAQAAMAELLEHEHKALESIFPRHVIEFLTLQGPEHPALQGIPSNIMKESDLDKIAALATSHACVTILFADIVGFTDMCKQIPALAVMRFLNHYFSRLDAMLDIYKVYKVETIGDCYMVAGGLVAYDDDGFRSVLPEGQVDPLHALRVLSFAKAMLAAASDVCLPTTGEPLRVRVGMHSGPIMSGIVGSKMPRFCLFGDTVNTASRMESTGIPGSIHVSQDSRDLLPNEAWRATPGVQVKGKGFMQTYLWSPGSEGAEAEAHGQMARVVGLYL